MHVDLTQPIETGMQTYPGDPRGRRPPPRDRRGERGSRLGPRVRQPHRDPRRRARPHRTRRKDARRLPLERFVFDAVRVDCRDLEAREPIPASRVPDSDADLVAFWTGWDAHWGLTSISSTLSLAGRGRNVCRPGPRRRRGRAQSGSDADRKRECGRAGGGSGPPRAAGRRVADPREPDRTRSGRGPVRAPGVSAGARKRRRAGSSRWRRERIARLRVVRRLEWFRNESSGTVNRRQALLSWQRRIATPSPADCCSRALRDGFTVPTVAAQRAAHCPFAWFAEPPVPR